MNKKTRALIPSEELDSTVSELLSMATERGLKIRKSPDVEVAVDGVETFDIPDVSEFLHADLRTFLEDEVTASVVANGGDIDTTEVRHEVAKKALIGIKLAWLREASKDLGLASRGKAEEVAERLAKHYKWDPEEIAQLVLSYEEEPTAEKGHVSRLFSFDEAQDTEVLHQRLDVVLGRYVRVGVAKWYVFESADRLEDQSLAIQGSFRSYGAEIDEAGDKPSLTPVPNKYSTKVQISDGSKILEVKKAGMQPARAAANAIQLAGGPELLGHVPFAGNEGKAGFGQIHPTSEFLLDIIRARLREVGFYKINLTIARFRISDTDDSDESRPTLRSIRFEGQHLLDSIPACQLLVKDRRPLVSIAIRAHHASQEGDVDAWFPIKISVENDHVAVATGFGSEPTTSLAIHRKVVQAVSGEIRSGIFDSTELDKLVAKIVERSKQESVPDEATILSEDF